MNTKNKMQDMQELDIEKFWEDDKHSHEENCFHEKAPQVALGIRMSNQCVYAELGVEGHPWGIELPKRRIELNKEYNNKAQSIVGKRLLKEEIPTRLIFPKIKRIGEVFGGTYEATNRGGQWLYSPINEMKALEKKLDEVDKMDLREFMLPLEWESEKKRIYEEYGKKPEQLRSVRGPVTLAMSIYGEENLIYLYYDAPMLYKRFSQTIADVIIKMADIMDVEAGYTKANAPHGYYFADDNCALLTPKMYSEFGYPVLKQVFERFSPNTVDNRYQHSDSEMAHLLPILAKLDLTACNFGPNVLVDKIRRYMPKTRIDGCLAPFTFMSNEADRIIKEVRRDCNMIKQAKTKGLNLSTAGSINNGSSLESMRLVMQVIQNFGRY